MSRSRISRGRPFYILLFPFALFLIRAGLADEPASGWLDTQLERDWPIPAQETLAYAPPIADGGRLYLRGERYLFCIGEK